MDGWVATHRQKDGAAGPLTMGYYTRDDLPFHYALADAFTICDGYHCSVLGPTYPNRLYYMTGSIDADGRYGGPVLNNDAYDGKILYTWETYPERLQRAGISWQVYFDMEDDYAAQHPASFSSRIATQPALVAALSAGTHGPSRCDISAGFAHRKLAASYVGHRAMRSSANTRVICRQKARTSSHQMLAGALVQSDGLGTHCVHLNYDENDGHFDHVVPPTPPPGTPGEFVDGLRSVWAFACRASSSRRFRAADTSAATPSIIPRCCGCSKHASASKCRTSPRGDARPAAISPPRSVLENPRGSIRQLFLKR